MNYEDNFDLEDKDGGEVEEELSGVKEKVRVRVREC
jgi:hypothetical protein